MLNELAAIEAESSDYYQGAVASLWRPLVMNQNALPPVGTADTSIDAARTSLQVAPNSALSDSIWLQPFYLTNSDPAADSRRAPAAPAANDLHAVAESRAGGLFRQLTMSTTDDLRGPMTSPLGAAIQPEQKLWDGGWTFDFPSIANPFTESTDPNSRVATRQGVPAGDAELVAFMQEAELIPEPVPADLDIESGESAQAGQGGAAGDAAQAESLAGAERLGSEPEDNSLQFLRTATVLLKPGESQYDIGLEYLYSETDFPILLTDGVGIVGVDDAKFRVRQLIMPLEYRTGLTDRVQGFLNVPVGWANTQVSLAGDEAFNNDGGLGDVVFGATMQLVDAEVDSPYWVGTLAVTAPTGGDPFTGLAGISPSAPSLGQGFWSISGNLLLIQPYDPLVVFYGLGMERFFPHDYIGLQIEPGAQYSYVLGVGFAVNDRVTLSTRFRGAYAEELEVDGERVIGSNSEPMSLRFSATISKPCDRIVEPFVEFGLTDDSVAAYFGVTWTFQPDKSKADTKQ